MVVAIYIWMLVLAQVQDIAGVYDLVSNSNVICKFQKAFDANWYCQTVEGYKILSASPTASAPYRPFTTTAGRPFSRQTGPEFGIFADNNFYYLLFNSAVNNMDQAVYLTPPLSVSGDSICIQFDYVMFGAEMGSVYVTTDFTSFDTFKAIDVANVKSTETNGRVETHVASGNQGINWLRKRMQIPLNGRNAVQLGLHVVRGNVVKFLSDVAFDNVEVLRNGSQCPLSALINGNWGQWSTFGTCSLTCGGGQQMRTRLCNNPSASNGGLNCVLSGSSGFRAEKEDQTQICNSNACPVDGNWGQWSGFGGCTKSCGGGQQFRTRLCNNPSSSNGGLNCILSGSSVRAAREDQSQICNSNLCPVNGNWGQWSTFGGCSVTCGGGQQSRTRSCSNPPASGGGLNCLKIDGITRAVQENQLQSCSNNICPVNGNWGQWSTFGGCSATCGGGQQSRTRSCNNPQASGGGLSCLKIDGINRASQENQLQACSSNLCPVNGNWGLWSVFGTCSKTCGGGQQIRTRLCNNPPSSNGGLNCILSGASGVRAAREDQSGSCNNNACPVNGNWGQWSTFGGCSVTCGGGQQSRTRSCSNPPSANGGLSCLKIDGITRASQENQLQACNNNLCPVNGNWGLWSTFGTCSLTCGGGQQIRSRLCNNPPSSNGGLNCLVSGVSGRRAVQEDQSQICNNNVCPVDGNWGQWSGFGGCSKSCGGGQQFRTRLCNSPTSSNGGLDCILSGSSVRAAREDQSQICNNNVCPVNGNWGQWSNFGTCSKTCGGGQQIRSRSCNNPSASNGGLNCLLLGSSGLRATQEDQSQVCSSNICAVNGNWGQWSLFGGCNVTCGGGSQLRTRSCNNPPASNGGLSCLLSDGSGNRAAVDNHFQICNNNLCSVNGNWGQWSGFGGCSKSCGGGQQTRTRLCNSPPSSNGGLDCILSGSSVRAAREDQSQICNNNVCPVNGNWGQWSTFGTCSLTCGGGQQSRTRFCNSPSASNGGLNCLLSDSSGLRAARENQSRICNSNVCAGDGNWGQWSTFGTCSKTCGGGQQSRTRFCNNPSASNGGLSCLLSDSSGLRATREDQTQVCSSSGCPVNGNWGQWSTFGTCSKTCGGGQQSRTRFCNNPSGSNGGLNCLLLGSSGLRATREDQSQICSNNVCVVNGNWGQWSTFGTCSKTCGGGQQSRTRFCNNPSASNGGLNCLLLGSSGLRATQEDQSQICSSTLCPVNGNWGQWSTFGSCSKTCGGGQQIRTRFCNNPSSSNGGLNCMLSGSSGIRATREDQSQVCSSNVCAVNGNWGQWSSFGTCSITCGGGQQQRTRACSNPPSSNGGLDCLLSTGTGIRGKQENQAQICNNNICPVNGNWGQWSNFGTCSLTCGGGQQSRTRFCSSPSASNGGLNCLLSDSTKGRAAQEVHSQNCNTNACPDGCLTKPCHPNATCSSTSGSLAHRCICNNMYQGNGTFCEESPCPSNFCQDTSAETCIRGSTNFQCVCKPGFVSGVKFCEDVDECDQFPCKNAACLNTFGSFNCLCLSGFTRFNSTYCAASAGCNGVSCHADATCITSSSGLPTCKCNNGFEGNGIACQDIDECTSATNPHNCPGNARCANSRGSFSCECSIGYEKAGANVCNDINECLQTPCTHAACLNTFGSFHCFCLPGFAKINSTDCGYINQWSAWSNFTACSKTCNFGVQSRQRTCARADLQGCPGSNAESKTCFVRLCPPTAQWNQWGVWSSCSGSCERGLKTRLRTCDQFSCGVGNATESLGCIDGCRLSDCPDDDDLFNCNFEKKCGFMMDNSGAWMIAKKTPSPSTGPNLDHTFPSGCGHFMFLEASKMTAGHEAYMVTPFRTSVRIQHCISLYISMHTIFPRQMGSLAIFLWQGSSLRPIWYHNGVLTGNATSWKEVNIDLSVTPGSAFALLFKAVRGTSFNSDMAIDDMKITRSSCTGPVNGNWGSWSSWNSCDVTCGEGVRMKRRTCSSPPASNGGAFCPGSDRKVEDCQKSSCPVQGSWSEWSTWGSCTKSCGSGLNRRMRECGSPHPLGSGSQCLRADGTVGLEESETRTCATQLCAVNGNWGQWSSFTRCSTTCGPGILSRTRLCNNPAVVGTGQKCVISAVGGIINRGDMQTDTQPCNVNACLINGNWANWGSWSRCSETCGDGVESRDRSCSNPAAANGGSQCPGNGTESRRCNLQLCIENGTWSLWTGWSSCDKSCGGGSRLRTRNCPTVPTLVTVCLKSNGALASEEKQRESCNTQICDRNGNWGLWSAYSACSATCGTGSQQRSRICDNPPKAGNGKLCLNMNGVLQLFETATRTCFLAACKVNGNWGQWSGYGTCSKTCGGGQQTRTRLCNNPSSSNGGLNCILSGSSGFRAVKEDQTQVCNNNNCAVNGNWGVWSGFGRCSVTCGGGQQLRTRTCSNPPSSNGGLDCLISGGSGVRMKQENHTMNCNIQLCPVNGNWGQWSSFGTCTKSCGGGQQFRTRICDSPTASNGGLNCILSGSSGLRAAREDQSQICNSNVCPVNGNWGQWSSFGTCSLTCGGGQQLRTRTCNNPPSSNGGLDCLIAGGSGTRMKQENQTQNCNNQLCPVNGNWGLWSTFGTCSRTCGGGQQVRTRFCNNPPSSSGGLNCILSGSSGIRAAREDQSQTCSNNVCPVNGNWGQWSGFGVCSITCGGGQQMRTRTCSNPPPSNGGLDCLISTGSGIRMKQENQTQNCNNQLCPVNGNWGQWSGFDACSVTCGGGQQMRTRSCSNPPSSNGGLDCLVSGGSGFRLKQENQTQNCNNQLCPVNGNWGQWSNYGACSLTCGGGQQTRTRFCNNPSSSNGGLNCILSGSTGLRAAREDQSRICNNIVCSVNGNWGQWSTFGTCSLTCGGGQQIRTRLCNNPPSSNGGLNCILSGSSGLRAAQEDQSQVCNNNVCPVNGNWGLWSSYGTCSLTCGGGQQIRTRLCNNPASSNGGLNCIVSGSSGLRAAQENQSRICNNNVCPVNGNWGQWSSFGTCSITCGGGQQQRTRTCSNPPSSNGGLDCLLSTGTGIRGKQENQAQSCNNNICPVNGAWGQWSSFGGCSVTCGGGQQTRARTCSNPPSSNGGLDCLLSSGTGLRATQEIQTQICNSNICAVNGNWGQWSSFDVCSVTCGGGQQNRSRTCSNPPASNGGLDCLLSDNSARAKVEGQTQVCSSSACPVALDCPIKSMAELGCDWVILPDPSEVFPSSQVRRWLIGSGLTPNRQRGLSTGPSGDADGSGFYLYVDSSNTPDNKQARIVSPLLAAGTHCLQFKYHMFGDAQGMLGVMVYGTDGNLLENDPVFAVFGNAGDQWLSANVTITTSQIKKLHIINWRFSGTTSDAAIDAIKVRSGVC